MKKSIMFLVFVVVLVSAIEPTPETKNTIEFICRSMEEFQFCNQTFYNNLQQPNSDNVTLTGITIVEAEKNATNTLNFIRANLPGEKDPNQHMHYVVCQTAYEILQRSFNQAFEAFKQVDYREMALQMRDTPRVQASCVTIFSIPPFTENPLNERNREMRILLTMAVVTGSLIVPK